MSNPELKPCPFCGGESEVERYGDSRRSTIYACQWCGCRLETGEEWGHGERWNERAADAEITALRERVAELEAAQRGTVITDDPATWPRDGQGVLMRHHSGTLNEYEFRAAEINSFFGYRWWPLPTAAQNATTAGQGGDSKG